MILALGVAAGLRRAEIAGLDVSDLDLDGQVIRVQGKGMKIREVPVKNGTLDALRAWLHHRGGWPGALVSPVRKGGKVEMGRLAPQAIQRACEKRARETGKERSGGQPDGRWGESGAAPRRAPRP